MGGILDMRTYGKAVWPVQPDEVSMVFNPGSFLILVWMHLPNVMVITVPTLRVVNLTVVNQRAQLTVPGPYLMPEI